MDWEKVRTEYIAEDTSYRKLAKKYGVAYNTICKRAIAENWQEQRQQLKIKIASKSIEKIAAQQAHRVAKFYALTDKLFDKLADALDLCDPADMQSIRQLTASLKDLKELQGIKSEADIREQEARIRNLESKFSAEEIEDNEAVSKELFPDERAETETEANA